MAVKIEFLRAPSLAGLECAINDFLTQETDDARIEFELVGGVSYAKDEYIVAVRTTAPHKRRFDGEEANEPA